jgi:hypothetical protein
MGASGQRDGQQHCRQSKPFLHVFVLAGCAMAAASLVADSRMLEKPPETGFVAQRQIDKSGARLSSGLRRRFFGAQASSIRGLRLAV